MTLSIDDVIAPTTAEEIFAEMLDVAATLGLPTTAWQSGNVIPTVLMIVAQVMANKDAVVPEMAQGGLGDFASPEWAKIWAKSIYGVDRIEASAAVGKVNFTNASGTPYTLNPGDVIVANAVTGQTYRNLALITIPASSSLNNVDIQADQVGTIGNAAPGAITTMVSSLVGVTVTNPLAVLGTDEETRDALVLRCRDKFGILSEEGVKEAYNFIAKTPQFSATSTAITRATTFADSATGAVSVYIATASGAPSGGDVTIVTDAIRKWVEPWGTTATAIAAVNNTIAVTYQVWLRTALSVTEVQTKIAVALAAYFAASPIGGYVLPSLSGKVYVEEIQRVIGAAVPGVLRVQVTLPASDVSIANNEVPVLGTVTPTVTVVT